MKREECIYPYAEANIAIEGIFDSMVTRDYLQTLEQCQIVPLNADIRVNSVRWFRIDKIVKEKDTFLIDKLSMLYTSLHNVAQNLILILNKENECIELYLGTRDFEGNLNVSAEVLEAGLQGYFPGIGITHSSLTDIGYSHPFVASVSAAASLRDEKKENFVQGIERLINATDMIPRFRAYFVADNVTDDDAKAMLDSFSSIYTELSPAEQLNITYSKSESISVNKSLSENFSRTIGESISNTVSHTEGSSDTRGRSSSSSTSKSGGLFGSILGSSNTSEGISKSESHTNNRSDSESKQTGNNRSETTGLAKQIGTSDSLSEGTSYQTLRKNRTVMYYLNLLDKQIEQLQVGRPSGFWSVATYFVANDSTTVQQLANIYRGCIIGEESGSGLCALNVWNAKDANEICKYLTNSINPRFISNGINVSAGTIVSSKELAIHLSFPHTSVPGIIVEDRSVFARNIITGGVENKGILLGNILHLGKKSDNAVCLNLEELTKHTFVTGSTGSGKSNAMYLMLVQIRELGKKFMVIEPAKGEYKHVFGCLDDVTVYSNTNKVGQVLRINPFCFPYKEVDVLEHIDSIVEIFNACWPMYAAMPAVLKHAIISSYENCGWDIYASEHKMEHPLFPNMQDVLICVKEYLNSTEFSEEGKGNYKGALEIRLQELCEGMFDKMFNSDAIADESLFNENVIVDLSRIKSTETKALIMGFLILKINEFRMSEGGMNKPLQHVTVLEEAHNLLKQTSTVQSQESSNLAGKSVEMIANSIAEMRTYGEAFIIVDQSPSALDQSVIRNTNTKIVLSLPDVEDRDIAGGSMTLSDDQTEEIGRQRQGEAIVYQSNWEEPVQCKISKFNAYKENFVYEKKSVPIVKQEFIRHVDVINFLLYNYIKQPFDIDTVRTAISSSSIPSSLRFSLNELLDEYKEKQETSLWHNRVQLAQTVRKYMNIDLKFDSIMAKFTDMYHLRKQFDELLEEVLSNDITTTQKYYIEQCYLYNNNNFKLFRRTFKK